MNRRIVAAVVRFAALCGLLVVPSVATAQLKCQEGDTTQIRRVTFEGNATFSDDDLTSQIIATPTDWTRQRFRYLLGTERCYRPGLLRADAARLKNFYSDQGFRDARVDTVKVETGRWVDLHFLIQEGEPDLVDSVSITGLEGLNLGDDLLGKLHARKGQRYSAAFGQADVDTIQARMRNAAHPLGVVLHEFPDIVNHRVNVTLTAFPGPPIRIGTVTIRSSGVDGRPTALDSNVIRDMLRFSPGDPYVERALIESERQFYRVGNFLSAEVTPDTLRARSEGLIDVTVTALEDLMHSISIEPGFGTLDCLRARVDYSDKSFLRGLNRFEASGQASKLGYANRVNGIRDFCGHSPLASLDDDHVSSSAVNYNTTLRITRPITLRGGLLPSFAVYSERRGAWNAYLRTTLIGGALSFSKPISRSVFAQMTYNLEYGRTKADETVLCFFFRACDESSRRQQDTDKRLAIIGASLSRDRRDRPDSTTRGTLLRVDTRVSDRLTGSDATLGFTKAVVDGTWYRRALGSGVIALRVRGGVIGGGTTSLGFRLPPPQERLYTGGETSVRGFTQNELGSLIYVADDTTGLGEARTCVAAQNCADPRLTDPMQRLRVRAIPLGGNAMYVGNLEYRLRGPFLSKLQTILFVDVGRLWTHGSVDSVGSANLVLQKPKWTPGIAFRYFSPIGPIQVNIGYNDYAPVNGQVFFDTGTTSAELICLSGESPPGSRNCLAASARRRPESFLSRLKFSIAFPPDF